MTDAAATPLTDEQRMAAEALARSWWTDPVDLNDHTWLTSCQKCGAALLVLSTAPQDETNPLAVHMKWHGELTLSALV